MSPNKLLLKFSLRHPTWITLTTLLGFSGAIFNGVSTTLIIPVLLELLGQDLQQSVSLPPIVSDFYGFFERFPDNQRIALMLMIVFLAIVLKNMANYASAMSSAILIQNLVNDIRLDGLNLLLEVDLDYHFKMRSGDIMQRLNDQVNRTAAAIKTLIDIARIALNIAFFIVLLLAISWKLTLTATVLLSLVFVVNQSAIARARKFGEQLSETSKFYSIRVLEMLGGIRLVRSTANESREFERIKDLIVEREKASFESQANFALLGPINEIGSILALILMVFIGRAIFNDRLDALATILLTYLFLLSRLIPFLGQLNAARGRFSNSIASIEVVHDFLRRDDKPFMVNGSVPFKGIQKEIHFDHISFRYPGTDALVINDVDLRLPKGSTLALVGSSGAGKSTLADLLPRFYDPTAGKITVDGYLLTEFELGSLRRCMGIVSQDTFLFNASIRDNIAYARPQATDHEILEAAKRANAYEFINRLPEGVETLIGDRGVLLSGGQRQRLAIARALVQDPDILILDEATSALDSISERIVQKALDDLRRDRTTLVIAHRLSTIQSADQIAVLDGGQVVEIGTHEQLLRQGTYYKRLYMLQLNESTQQIIKAAQSERLTQFSYEIRNHLNTVLGSLQLLADGLADDPQERRELTEEAYQSALELLQRLETGEKEVKAL
ncbi:MAG: ATP-binding cassette domain-containing protein [Leptolyngbyaceae cyanobacterium SM1_1_3]|nr:ATP-binding cassette domain-containing protein [Leptolyngbyaceae cyanobacterium SM1_1_3]NJN01932.1 ATP-binding cassette domain-containing protein [Leptolyngbyaceae cyanobacterium RM1_1_2]NJO10239.1 ATP-binding cassette domain-containing protein [Leptolyngbyaceae cyanobacterium SL_1_1]